MAVEGGHEEGDVVARNAVVAVEGETEVEGGGKRIKGHEGYFELFLSTKQ